MQLGAVYNLFDGEETLRDSILSIRSEVCFVGVVYQKMSHMGEACHPNLPSFLNSLVAEGLVDELYLYEASLGSLSPRQRTDDGVTDGIRERFLSTYFDVSPLYSGSSTSIIPTFFFETIKRDIGREMCLKRGCTHFMSLDVDEFYSTKHLRNAKQRMLEGDYDVGIAKIANFFREPTWELTPCDNSNLVPVIYKCSSEMTFRLLHPYPCVIDPTRGVGGAQRVVIFERDQVEMIHLTYCRYNILKKLRNVSNCDSYKYDAKSFVPAFIAYTGVGKLPMPHPIKQSMFQGVIKREPHPFEINYDRQCFYCLKVVDPSALLPCPKCAFARYCSRKCMEIDTPHAPLCDLFREGRTT